MDVQDFTQFHLPGLEADEVRFNLQIAVLMAAAKELPEGFAHWTFGPPGHCAIQWPGRAILLGNLDKAECQSLAQTTWQLRFPGVVGAGDTAHWFVECARANGAAFKEPIPQRIYVLCDTPFHPGARGLCRQIGAADTPLLFEWMTAFQKEAVPLDPPPERAQVAKAADSGRYLFWTIDDRAVSVAAVSRRLRHTGAISPVYTPPDERGQGYAGSVTAAVVERNFAEGKTAACLYADLRNPASNRCYAKLGFKPHCDSWHYPRAPSMSDLGHANVSQLNG